MVEMVLLGNPLAWTLYGLAASQFGNLDNHIEIRGQSSKPLNEFLSNNLGYDHSFLGYVALAHLVFVTLFFFVYAYSIKYLNFHKR